MTDGLLSRTISQICDILMCKLTLILHSRVKLTDEIFISTLYMSCIAPLLFKMLEERNRSISQAAGYFSYFLSENDKPWPGQRSFESVF